MKTKVKRRFTDKNTGATYDIGSSYNCTSQRYKEINRAGAFLYEVKEPEEETEVNEITEKEETKKKTKEFSKAEK